MCRQRREIYAQAERLGMSIESLSFNPIAEKGARWELRTSDGRQFFALSIESMIRKLQLQPSLQSSTPATNKFA